MVKIEDIDLRELSSFISNDEAKGYFLLPEGAEHYKLLAHLSTLEDGMIISDIGTFRGCSALALSYNKSNRVISYDVANHRALNGFPDNIEFVNYNKPFSEDILRSRIIMLDTMHDGIQEKAVIDFLAENKWKGTLVMDDIHHFPALNVLWKSLKLKKKDVTEIGHWSGTGIIEFK